jgi:hypothetical protein
MVASGVRTVGAPCGRIGKVALIAAVRMIERKGEKMVERIAELTLREQMEKIPIDNDLSANRYDSEFFHTLHIWDKKGNSYDIVIEKAGVRECVCGKRFIEGSPIEVEPHIFTSCGMNCPECVKIYHTTMKIRERYGTQPNDSSHEPRLEKRGMTEDDG